MEKVVGLFPTPCMICQQALDGVMVSALKQRALDGLRRSNTRTDLLSHTEMINPSKDAELSQMSQRLAPLLSKFGGLMFGQDLNWLIKEAWLNVLQPGGSQYMHSHANSFASGVIYLTPQHPSSRTVFLRPTGNTFVFKNEGDHVQTGPYNGDKWVMPEVAPGDMVLYPSHLMHGVPPNEGAQRVTLALNAIPNRLDSHGYQISFSS